MDPHHAVVDLAAVAIVLPSHPNRVVAAFANSRFVDVANGLGMSMIMGHDLLTAISHAFVVPLDRFDKTL
jgi:hypothetical protein